MTADYYNHEEEEQSFDLGQIVDIAKRRFLFFLIPTIIGSIIAVAVVYLIPQRYESLGTVLVESQQIPVELVQSTVTTDPNQRITIIKQRVMTRNNLLKIIDKYDVFKEERKKLSVSKLIESMEKLIQIDVITADIGGRRGSQTIAFKVGFQHENPAIAAQVANELVTLFLSENVRTRTARASETTEFLQQEATKLRDQLNAAEQAISEFKQKNKDSLPEQLSIRMSMLERTKDEIKAYTQRLSSLEDERKYLEVEISAAKSGQNISKPAQTPENTTELELEKARDALVQLSTRLTDRHPDIKSLKRRISALEEKLLQEQAADVNDDLDPSMSGLSPSMKRLVEQLQLRMESNEKARLEAESELARLRAEGKDLEAKILKTPEVERDLTVLVRKHREILSKYQELEAKQGKARLAQNLEEEKKAERFILLEPPVPPTEPVWPNRPKFLGIGGFIAFAMGIGTAVLMELVDRRIRTSKELETLLKDPPLATIPYIKTRRDIQKKRYKFMAVLAIPAAIGLSGIVAIHVFYKPLDLLFYQVWSHLQKLGILP